MTKEKKVQDAVDQVVSRKAEQPEKKSLIGNISTGVTLIDLAIGGGYPYGFVNAIGDSGSGKSFLSGETIADCIHRYDKDEFGWFYDDGENGFRFAPKKIKGKLIDIKEDGFLSSKYRSRTIEDIERNIQLILKKKDPKQKFIYVVDSWDSISSEDEIKFKDGKLNASIKKFESESEKKEKESGTYGLSKNKEAHSFFRTKIRDLENNNMIVVIISQTKEKINVSFGRKLYRTGGAALDFYPNIIYWLSEAHYYEKMDRTVGTSVRLKVDKSRNDKPFRTCYFDLIYDYGIDNVLSNVNFLFDLKTETGQEKKKLICEWDGKEISRNDLIKHIEDNNLESELERLVVEKWNRIEDEISSKDRKSKWS